MGRGDGQAKPDITDQGQAEAAVAQTIERFGRVDDLVNNAGFGCLSYFEELASDEVRSQFETNVFGTMNVLRAALPVLRRRPSRRIINFSSLGGVTCFEGSTGHSASKFAIECMSEAPSRELGPFGITVTIIEPGYIRTDFLNSGSMRYGTTGSPRCNRAQRGGTSTLVRQSAVGHPGDASMEKPTAATRRKDEYERMASALAEGGEVGFCGPASPQGGDEDVNLRYEGDAFIAKRIDGSTPGVFASLDAALDAIEDELIGRDAEA